MDAETTLEAEEAWLGASDGGAGPRHGAATRSAQTSQKDRTEYVDGVMLVERRRELIL